MCIRFLVCVCAGTCICMYVCVSEAQSLYIIYVHKHYDNNVMVNERDRGKTKNEVIVWRCMSVRGMRAKKYDVKTKIRRCNIQSHDMQFVPPLSFFLFSICLSFS